MGHIYAYAPDADDYSSIGLVGALMPQDTEFEIQGGEFGEFTMVHPIDEYGKWMALQDGVILKMMVPVRLAPEIENGAYVTTVEKWKVSNTATKAQRYIYSKATEGKKKKLLSVGTKVTVVSKGIERYKVKTGKYSGWMDFGGLEFEIRETVPPTPQGLETAEPSYAIRQQLFRIYEVIPSDGPNEKNITVRARRKVYDLLGNLSTYRNSGAVTCQQALNGLLNNCIEEHVFEAFTDIGDSRTAVDFRDMNPIQALIDPSEGIAARWGGQVICDDDDIYILRKAGMKRGLTIEYQKNMTGIKCTVNTAKVASAIRPRGQTKSGEPLYLAGSESLPAGYYFGSGKQKDVIYSNAAASYAVPKILSLECTDCKVNDDVTTTLARTRMIEQTIAKFESGCAVPEISLDVDFIMLGDTQEFSQYRHLEPLFIYDSVPIKHPRIGVYADVECSLLKWDPVMERVISSKFGALTNATASVANWQINSVSGGKIIPYTIGSQQMSDDIINARHLQAESVNAEAIQAGSVTAEKLSADEIKAFIIEAVRAKIGEIVAGKITTDELFTAILDAVKLSAETGNFTFAEIQNLLANTLFVVQGVGEKVQIANLSVTEANIVSLSVGDLLIRNENGEMVRLYVDADGNVQTGDPIADGTLPGAKIIEGSITTAQLNAEEIFANDGVIMNLIASSITANEAFIDSVVTSTIGNLTGQLDMFVRKDNLETYLRLLTDGVHVGQTDIGSEVVVTPGTVDVRLNGTTYSQFASNYVQFGRYQLRKSPDGGLVFKIK